MSTRSFDVRPVAGALGAEVVGVELARADEQEVAAIRQALLTHRVLFFRGQDLTGEQQMGFAERFGSLTTAHPTVRGLADAPKVFDIDSAEGNRTNVWHTDVTFVDRPPMGSILRAVEVPEYGGDTCWANTVRAYEHLSPAFRSFIDGLDAVHTNEFDYSRTMATVDERHADAVKEYGRQFMSTQFRTRHPLVRIHPETGERALLAGGFARFVDGLDRKESTAVLKVIHDHVVALENTVRWRWSPGDVVFWDNRSTQHYAIADYGEAPRRVQRVTVAGIVPVGIDGRRSEALEGDSSAYTPRDELIPA
jgi:taurine dioxygenase